MKCPHASCVECGGKLIHQDSKKSDESSSALGQHVHDSYPTTFYFMDIDAAIYKRATRILRIVEHKNPDQVVRPSQRAVLPMLSLAVQGMVQANLVHPESGVFVLWSEGSFDTASVSRVTHDGNLDWTDKANAVQIEANLLQPFLTGQSLLDSVVRQIQASAPQ